MTPTFKTKKIILNQKVKRKISFGIISVVMVGIFLLPISPSLNKTKQLLTLKTNKASAEIIPKAEAMDSSCLLDFETKLTSVASDGFTLQLKLSTSNPAKDSDGNHIIETTGGLSDVLNAINNSLAVTTLLTSLVSPSTGCFLTGKTNIDNEANAWASVLTGDLPSTPENTTNFVLPSDGENAKLRLYVSTDKSMPNDASTTAWIPIRNVKVTASNQTINVTFSKTNGLTQAGQNIFKDAKTLYAQFDLKTLPTVLGDVRSNKFQIDLKADSSTIGNANQEVTDVKTDFDFSCGITNLGGCIAQIFYVIWEVSALIAKLAAKFLDFFVYYSTDNASYTSGFVEKGWGAVRDIANMFFIIALLYVAIKTILGLNVSDNKKIIGYVVIIALLLNFSLFFTKVVIDGSNILAKIFYNNITSINTNGQPLPPEAGGQKSISVGLVDKFNPQNIVTQEVYDQSTGTFIFLTLLLIAIMLYMAYMFFAVAILFVSRVVSLWISMIFSPIAFASYTVPFDIPGFGHKEWWGDLFKNAFLAPIFVFMLYIIVMFAGFLNTIPYADGDTSSMAGLFQHVMHVVIPFIILFVLLMKAKELAVKYSGEMGKAIMKGAQMIGGVALGAVAGGAAIAGRATLGRLGSKIANSEKLKDMESRGVFGAQTLRNLGKAGGKGSMDIRGAKIAGTDLAKLTGMKVGKEKEGGYDKMRADKTAKRIARAKELEPGEDSEIVQKLHTAERQQKAIENKYSHETKKLSDEVTTKRQASEDANRTLAADQGNEVKKKAANKAAQELKDAQIKLANINNGGFDAIKNEYRTTNGNITRKEHDDITTAANDAANDAANAANIKTTAINNAAAIETTATQKAGEEEAKAIADAEKIKEEAISKAKKELAIAQTAAAASVSAYGSRSAEAIAAQNIVAATSTKLINIETAQTTAVATATANAATKKQQAINDAAVDYRTAVQAANQQEIETLNANTAAQQAKNFADASANNGYGESINTMKKDIVPNAHHHLETRKNEIKAQFSTYIKSDMNKALNMITSVGQHSNHGANEASHKIFMDMKTEDSKGH